MRSHWRFLGSRGLIVLLTASCGQGTSYIVDDGYEGPVAIVFAVPGASHPVDRSYLLRSRRVTLTKDQFRAGTAHVYYDRLAGRVPVPEESILGFGSIAYAACDSIGSSLEPVSLVTFFVGHESVHPMWRKELETARLQAIATALDRMGRPKGAACARDEIASPP